ncbi:MAG: HD domain-containing protein [Ruminococcus sp.]|nr:HD domain-containing protein [Ruminococcus sp.]
MLLFYDILFSVSLVLTLIYAFMWHKHFDVHFTVLFILIPISELGYCMLAHSKSIEAALAAQKVIYLGGCYLMVFILLSVLSLCRIELRRWQKTVIFVLTSVVYTTVLTIGEAPLFYKEVERGEFFGATYLIKTYGPAHTVFYLLVVVYFAMSIFATIYSYFLKKDVSRKIIYLLIIPEMVSVMSFLGGRFITKKVEAVSVSYLVAQVIFLVIIDRICLYDISETAIESLVQTGDTGLISFDFQHNYLASNSSAKRVFPQLAELTVDKPASESERISETLLKYLDEFEEDETKNRFYYSKYGRSFLIQISYLYDGRHKRGYQLMVTDDTKNRQYIDLINRYNSDLKAEVAEKTSHIIEMHDRLILSMATMVESRDNSTGGHIKRTSQGVRILIEEINRLGGLELTEEFCKDIIKAAPMHDLGKIAVDDAILRKPGRFTPEEFEKMKSHAAEGAKIVHEILKGTDDIEFHIIAENVAHYHHERWDGSGYPDGLKGEEIPLEARIMAIADVYDALVSKRVYKEKMSFEQADSIIMEGMGKHFDKRLEPYYVSARPRLEEYYSSIE